MESKNISVRGVNIHYIEEGTGKTVLFLHGLSSSSYMWRNIIPIVSQKARCVAIDFVGAGESDKPKIDYDTADYLFYLESFIEALNLTNITLVMYGWSTIIGLAYAEKHVSNVSGLVFADPYLHLKKKSSRYSDGISRTQCFIKK